MLQFLTLMLMLLCILIFILLPIKTLKLSPIFLHLFFAQDFSASGVALLVAAVAYIAVDQSGRMEAILRHTGTHPTGPIIAVFTITALGAVYIYHAHALSMDEYAPFLQSQIFAAGHLTGQLPVAWLDLLIPVPHQQVFINVSHSTGAIASAYWPGLALVMTPFTWLGVAWLCNPAITAATVWALSTLLKELVEDSGARGLALCATVVSPVILMNGMSFYGMPLQLLCSVMFTLGIVRGTPRQLLMAGAWGALGLTAVNPVPFAIYGAPWLFWLGLKYPRSWRRPGWLILGGLPLALLLGLGWRIFLLSHVNEPTPATLGGNAIGLLNVFQLPTQSLLFARLIAGVKLCVWAVPCLPLLALAACPLWRQHYWIALLSSSVILTIVIYFFVPFDQGHGWGYRYFHTVWLALPLMAAAAMQRIGNDAEHRQRVYGFVFVICALTLLWSDAWRARQVEIFVREHLEQIPARVEGRSRQAVFIDVHCGHYTADLIQNPPILRDNALAMELRLVSRGPQKDAAQAAAMGINPRMVASTPCARRWVFD
jgi:hypothetical protein